MTNKKPWYKKIGVFITIVASICTILSFLFSIKNKSGENINETNSSANSSINNIEGDGVIVNAPIEIGGDVIIDGNKYDITSTQTLESEEIQNQDVIDEVSNYQPYPDDYVIVWEDKTFEKLMQECLGKHQILYGDIKNITSLQLYSKKIIINENEIEDKATRFMQTDDTISLNDLQYFSSLSRLSIHNFASIDCDIFNDVDFANKLYVLEVYIKLDSAQILEIAKLNNLVGLVLVKNDIGSEELNAIATLENLYELILWNNNITDISPIANLKQLIYLDISDNKIENIDALNNLEILDTLILCGNDITDYSPVSHVTKIIKTPEEAQKYYNSDN